MTGSVFSIVFDRRGADPGLTKLTVKNLVMALLVCHPPEPAWEGCEVYAGDSPLDAATTHCVAMRGPGADGVQERLVVELERMKVRVAGVYEGGPEEREFITRVQDGRWLET